MNQSEHANTKRARSKRKSPLPFIILSLAIILAVVGGLRFYLKGVSTYSPKKVIEQYYDCIEQKNYDALCALTGFTADTYNTKEDYIAFLENAYQGGIQKLAIAKSKEKAETATSVFYDTQVNGGAVKTFELKKTGKKEMLFFDTWTLVQPEDLYAHTLTVKGPAGLKLTVNDVPVPTNDVTLGNDGTIAGFSTLEGQSKMPKVHTYTLEGLIKIGSVTATLEDGTPCTVSLEGDSATVTAPIDAALSAHLKELGIAFSKKYAAFITEDAAFSALSPYLYKESTFYESLKTFSNMWFTTHDSFGYENIQVKNETFYSPQHCSLEVSFNYVLKMKSKRVENQVDYQLYFMKVEDDWLIVNLIAL